MYLLVTRPVESKSFLAKIYARWPWYIRLPSKKTSEPNLIWPLAQMRLRLSELMPSVIIVCTAIGNKKPSSNTLSATNSLVCASGTNFLYWNGITCAITSTWPIRMPCALALGNKNDLVLENRFTKFGDSGNASETDRSWMLETFRLNSSSNCGAEISAAACVSPHHAIFFVDELTETIRAWRTRGQPMAATLLSKALAMVSKSCLSSSSGISSMSKRSGRFGYEDFSRWAWNFKFVQFLVS